MKNTIIIGIFLTLSSCTMKPQIKHNEYKELHKHKGTENYEVEEVVPKTVEVSDFFGKDEYPNLVVDTIKSKTFARAYGIKELHYDLSGTYNTNFLGNYIGKEKVSGRVLKDGTIWETGTYSNLLINGDTTKHKYIDPFSNKEIDDPYEFTAKEKDPEKWFVKFKELHTKAIYIYIFSSFYYFKIDTKWYCIKTYKMGKANNIDIKKQYPAKEDQDVRMVELQDMSPKYFIPPNERDTQLIREMEYESMEYEEENFGLIKQGYSAGWWYLEIYMPLGDVIKIKRFASFRNPDLQLYKIPAAYDGRYDVLFIVQEPNPIHMPQVAGMYVIRPRDPEQPQYRYKRTSFYRDKEGFKHINLETSIETDEYKAWVKKKKR